MKARPREQVKKTADDVNHVPWHELNRKQRRETMRKIQSQDLSLEVVHPDAAGIDIGNEFHYVAVPPGRDSLQVRRYGCTTDELKAMAAWLKLLGIRTVAMQSTGVYWIAVFDRLEAAGLEVYLVNARDTKNLPGRKSDVQESQSLMKLHTYGLLRNSFPPPQEVRIMRTYWRQRNDLVRAAASHKFLLIVRRVVILGLIALTMAVSAQAPTQEAFATPDEAAKMPQHGFKTTDMPLLDRMFTGTVQEFSSERPHRRQERPRGPSPNVGLDMLKNLLWTAIPAIPGCEKMWNSGAK